MNVGIDKWFVTPRSINLEISIYVRPLVANTTNLQLIGFHEVQTWKLSYNSYVTLLIRGRADANKQAREHFLSIFNLSRSTYFIFGRKLGRIIGAFILASLSTSNLISISTSHFQVPLVSGTPTAKVNFFFVLGLALWAAGQNVV